MCSSDLGKLIERKIYIDKLLAYKDKDIIKVVTGLRRSGKSTLLEMYEEQLLISVDKPEQIQFYNFELPENFVNKSWDTIYFEIKSKLQSKKRNYIFLDEIQNIDRKSTRLNSSHIPLSRMPSSA